MSRWGRFFWPMAFAAAALAASVAVGYFTSADAAELTWLTLGFAGITLTAALVPAAADRCGGAATAFLAIACAPWCFYLAWGVVGVPLTTMQVNFGWQPLVMTLIPILAVPLAPIGAPVLMRARYVALLALIALACATAIMVAGARRPDPDAYLRSLPTMGTLQAGGRVTLPAGPLELEGPRHDYDSMEDTHFDSCLFAWPARGPDAVIDTNDTPGSCGPYTLLSDRARDIVYFHLGPHNDRPSFALRGRTGDLAVVTPHELSGIGPPVSWAVHGGVGVVVACLALILARRQRRQALGEGLLEAEHDGQGRLKLLDGLATLAAAPPVAPGPVLVRLTQPLAMYRTNAAPEALLVHAGTLADLRQRCIRRARQLDACAFAIAVVALAPACAAAVGGVLV